MRAAFPDVAFGAEYGDGFGAEPAYVHDWAINPPAVRGGRVGRRRRSSVRCPR